MVIVDTSIWINHLRKGDKHLEKLLLDAEVICHEFVIGELACGNLKNRNEIISLLQSLPHSPTVDHQEFLYFIDKHQLMGRGIGFVDVLRYGEDFSRSAVVPEPFTGSRFRTAERLGAGESRRLRLPGDAH